MNITIASPNGVARSIEISKEMEEHFNVPANHAHTILKQINSGMYDRFFKGKKDLVCMDFGANVGLVSLYMAPACKELHCIEPTPSHFYLLGDWDTGAKLYNMALTKQSGTFDFFTSGSSTENRITERGANEGAGSNISVKGEPLSYFLSQTDSEIDFVKIDIEGGEMAALTTENLLPAFGKVKMFYVEVHPWQTMDINRNELLSRFKKVGYNTEVLNHETIIAFN
jgi:FkbM family methyltransferase